MVVKYLKIMEFYQIKRELIMGYKSPSLTFLTSLSLKILFTPLR